MDIYEHQRISGTYTALSFLRDLDQHEIAKARAYSRGGSATKQMLPPHREYSVSNLCPINGRNVLARRLAGDTTYTGTINYGAFGSGTSAFTTSSTQLNTEVYRKAATDASASDNIAYVDWYIATGDVANQTFNEFGAFIDGTGSANTGRAMSLALTGGWVKSGAMFISLAVSLV